MLQAVLEIARAKKYKIFTRPYELNIWGIRSRETRAGYYDDVIFVFWINDKGNWETRTYQASTDPSDLELQTPSFNAAQIDGTAIMEGGQYLDSWTLTIGYKRLGVEELAQIKAITIIRDFDRDAYLSFTNGKKTTGIYAINIHVGSRKGQKIDKDSKVGLWGAGCQVIARFEDMEELVSLAKRHAQLYGNTFSYTLVDRKAVSRARIRNSVWAIGAAAAATLVYLGLK